MTYCVVMATNLAIDDKLLAEAKKLGHFPSKKETVNSALREFIDRRKQKEVVHLFGKVDYDSDYDYKKLRNRRDRSLGHHAAGQALLLVCLGVVFHCVFFGILLVLACNVSRKKKHRVFFRPRIRILIHLLLQKGTG